MPLSVLDLSPVPSGTSGAQALRNTVDLARRAERMGYSRYWLAEHHNTPGLVSSSPEVMIGQVASATDRIRVGAGGIMLPNHSPLRVAEAFRVLEALHPGRIDLGLGRAPGTDGITAVALRRSTEPLGPDEFPALVAELLAYAGAGFPERHPFRGVAAVPSDVALPPLWILGSSPAGAQVAAALGAGFAFARHLNPRGAVAAMEEYRARFRPSPALAEPRSILALSVVCADTDARAEELVASLGLSVVRMRSGRAATLPTPEEALAHPYGPAERDQLRRYRRAQVAGEPGRVRDELLALRADTAADELMLMTTVHDHEERVRSYALVARALGLGGPEPSALTPGGVGAASGTGATPAGAPTTAHA